MRIWMHSKICKYTQGGNLNTDTQIHASNAYIQINSFIGLFSTGEKAYEACTYW